MPNAQSRHLESESWAVNDTEQSGRWLAMKKILLLVFCSLVFMSASGAFLWSMLSDCDTVLIVPTILMFLCSCVFLFLLFKEIFIGHNEYIFEDSVLRVTRKGKHIASIEKGKLERIVIICDMLTKEEEVVSFLYEKKRFYIQVTRENKEELKAFIGGIPCKIKDNILYYLISFLSH